MRAHVFELVCVVNQHLFGEEANSGEAKFVPQVAYLEGVVEGEGLVL